MPVRLRPRTARTNYAAMLNAGADEDEDVGGGALPADVDSDSESAFSLPSSPEHDDGDDGDPDIIMDDNDDDGSGAGSGSSNHNAEERPAAPAVVAASRPKRALPRRAGLSRPSHGQFSALPAPNGDHRFRPQPLYTRHGRAERLQTCPAPFGPDAPATTPTNSYTHSDLVRNRLNRAWNTNVGPGPLWELMEDRSWWKEAERGDGAAQAPRPAGDGAEQATRPAVYRDVPVPAGWSVGDAGRSAPGPPFACAFGPHGAQTRTELPLFAALDMSELFPDTPALVFNAGAPVWALDWCPLFANASTRRTTQYLAIAPFPSPTHAPAVGRRVPRPAPASIQVWSVAPRPRSDPPRGAAVCELVLSIDSGPALELRFCPLPAHDDLAGPRPGPSPRKLGLLGGIFEDGSFSLYAVPYPPDIAARPDTASPPPCVHLPEPIVRIELEDAHCLSFDWANSEVIAIGCTNGAIAVYDIAEAIRWPGTVTDLIPTHYFSVHQSAVRAIAWIRAPPSSASGEPQLDVDPTTIASGGFDGAVYFTDIRQTRGNAINRTRDVIQSMCFSPFAGGALGIDNDHMVKVFSASPNMLGRGHMLLEPGGPVWSIDGSDYHAQVAVGSADGSCLTTNTLRSTRRGKVPTFQHKIYQLDYSPKTGEFRMLEHFLPQEIQDARTRISQPSASAAWPAEVSVTCVRWNNGSGLARAPWLASATACGLCRVDWLMGRWMLDKMPYERIESIRHEAGGADGDEEEDELADE